MIASTPAVCRLGDWPVNCPTKQQTGTELFQLVHQAASAFPRVALYFENSILAPDWNLLPAAAATVTHAEQTGDKRVVESPRVVGIPVAGLLALVDGEVWPVLDAGTLWLPPGTHVVEPGSRQPALRIEHFNGDLKSARVEADGVEITYQGTARVLAILSSKPRSVQIDGVESAPVMVGEQTIVLPRGQHLVTLR